jgi:hypothetical protein
LVEREQCALHNACEINGLIDGEIVALQALDAASILAGMFF